MLRVLSVSGVCSVMKSARRKISSSSTFSTPISTAALGRQEGIIGDHLHAQATAAVGNDRADVAAADDAQRLVEELDAHEAVLLPLAGMGGGIGLRGSGRASAIIIEMACSAVVMALPKGVFITTMRGWWRPGYRHCRRRCRRGDDLVTRRRRAMILGVTLVADRMARPS